MLRCNLAETHCQSVERVLVDTSVWIDLDHGPKVGETASCCGGTGSQCPPGTEVSKVSWVGTCRNGKDGKDYLSCRDALQPATDSAFGVCATINNL
jgi:hypothetical protein